MASLQMLPPEILVDILSYLSLRHLEKVALTFSHPLTELSVPRLQPLFHSQRVSRRLFQQFGPLQDGPWPNDTLIKGLGEQRARRILGILPEHTIQMPDRELWQDLDFLPLGEDLKWMKPMPQSIFSSFDNYGSEHEMNYRELVDSAERLGVTVPAAFLEFFRDQRLMRERFRCDDNLRFYLPPGGLRKVPKMLDGGVGGYAIDFAGITQDSPLLLYLEPRREGGYCLLNSFQMYEICDENCQHPRDVTYTEEEMVELEAQGILPMDQVEIHLDIIALDFEKWLAHAYFRRWLYSVLNHGTLSSGGLQQYVKRLYVSRDA
jgi:hypothetical protein